MAAELARLGIRGITLHGGLYDRNRAVTPTDWFAWRGLRAHGWNVQRSAGPVFLFEHRVAALAVTPTEPPRTQPIFCQGWYGNTGSGRYMSERHAPFWIYGSGELRLRFAASELPRRVTVDGRTTRRLHGRGWHLVTVDVPRLVRMPRVEPRVGLKLVDVVSG
jgi:hypothetical protein